MFKKFARLEDRAERLEIYNLLRFNLGACLRVLEFFFLAVSVSGLAWLISSPLIEALGRKPGSALTIGLLLLAAALLRFPFLYALTALEADFGLDPRPVRLRLTNMLKRGLRLFLIAWLLSLVLFWALVDLNLWLWSLLALVVGLSVTLVKAFFPGLLDPETLRPLQDGEVSPALLKRLDLWKDKIGLDSRRLMVASGFSPGLEPPYLRGLGKGLRLVIPEKALAQFTPRELELLLVSSAMEGLVKAPLKFLFLRLCSLAVAVPLASIFISAIGGSLWGYPLLVSPALIVLVWAAFWLGHWVAELTIRLTRRSVQVQLAAAASVLLKDEDAVEAALSTLAAANLEETDPPAWREFFLPRHSKKEFLRRIKYQQHISKFNG